MPGVTVRRSSRVYDTEPVGPEQPRFLNAVVEVEAALSARELLSACLDVEERLGRVRGERWGPRVVDLDLLTFGDERIDDPDLQVPHPRIAERGFVLAPLLELTREVVLAGGMRVTEARPPLAPGAVRPFAPALPVPPV